MDHARSAGPTLWSDPQGGPAPTERIESMKIVVDASRVAGALLTMMAAAASALAQSSADVRPTYLVRDGDPQLTAIARTALPLIGALDRFRAAHGRCPRLEDRAEFAALLPPGTTIVGTFTGGFVLSHGEIPPWIYQAPAQQDPAQCSLSRKLGWDPDLVYEMNGVHAHWVFAPGDGSDDRAIELSP
jgi:hypothetical protein